MYDPATATGPPFNCDVDTGDCGECNRGYTGRDCYTCDVDFEVPESFSDAPAGVSIQCSPGIVNG